MTALLSPPTLSIIIVSWNVCELLRACLQSISARQGNLSLEVIVVDSGSNDGSPEMIRQIFPEVKLIARPDNVGFPKGNNLGLAQANGRYLLLLNPDTEIVNDALSTMINYMEYHRHVGALGPQLLNPDSTVQSSRRRFPTLITAFFESTWLENLAPQKLLRNYYVQDVSDGDTVAVDWITGACLLTRHEVYEQIGGLDEGYFMYSEELDWCRRIKEAGWQVVYLPTAQVLHHEGKSSEQAVTHRHINYHRAKLRYFRKYHGRLAATTLRIFLLMNYIWQIKLEAMKGIIGHKRPLRWQRVKSYWQVIRSGLRPAGY
jgi:GT2 family glycosyltransferase